MSEENKRLARAFTEYFSTCESMIEIVRYTQRNVKRWRDGDMRRRSLLRRVGGGLASTAMDGT